jgi:hypothetical protein
VGSSSDKKNRRLPMQLPGYPMGTHDSKRSLPDYEGDPCRCGSCSSGIKASTAAKIGNKAIAQEASASPKKGKK